MGNLPGRQDAAHGVLLHTSDDRLRTTAKHVSGFPRYEVLQEVGKEGTYDFIFDVGRNSGIVYAAEGKYDLTESVLERLDLAREKKRDTAESQGATEDTAETQK